MLYCIALRNYDPHTLHRHRLLNYRLNLVSSVNICLEESCTLEDFSVDDHTCHLMADVVCGDLP